MKSAILFLTLLFICGSAQANCNFAQAERAEASVDNLKTWQAVYESFKQYAGCDDGDIAEGYSDGVVKLLAYHWNDFASMQKFTSADPEFYDFVIKHIDATTDWDDLKALILHASHECPKNARTLCLDIKRKASLAYQEAKSVGGG